MNAERRRIDVHNKEVTLLKRGVIVVAVLALALMLTASAYASNGYRNTYSPSTVCSVCHSPGSPVQMPAADLVYQAWATSAHANSAINPTPTGGLADNALPTSRGASCAGCHSGNYNPAQDVPVAGATPVVYPTVVDTANPNNAFTEPDIGCSSCHYGTSVGAGTSVNPEADPADTAHMSPLGNLANPQICGQCHSHYATNVTPYALATPVPGGTISNAMYPLGYNGLGSATTTPPWTPNSLSALINVPTPTASQTALPFWSGGQAELSHNGGGDEYVEWAETLGQTVNGAPVTSHANALATLQAMMPDPSNPSAPANAFLNSCLQCHSTDYRIDAAAGQATPTIATAKYGITCVACHDPHSAPQQANGQPVAGTNTAMWSAANPQLATSESTLCIQCHTGQIAAPATVNDVTQYAMFPAGQEVHNATKEMMGGYGALNGVATSATSKPSPLIGQASVHKAADCVECHMVSTGYDTHDNTASGANHVFAIVTPSEAASQLTSFNVTVNGVSAPQTMPVSSCSGAGVTCHGNSGNQLAAQMQGAMDSIQSGMQDAINAVSTQLALDANR
ncbi:MAG: multiheme c-type cytochrome, partial [Thermoleophilia bacterium]